MSSYNLFQNSVTFEFSLVRRISSLSSRERNSLKLASAILFSWFAETTFYHSTVIAIIQTSHYF